MFTGSDFGVFRVVTEGLQHRAVGAGQAQAAAVRADPEIALRVFGDRRQTFSLPASYEQLPDRARSPGSSTLAPPPNVPIHIWPSRDSTIVMMPAALVERASPGVHGDGLQLAFGREPLQAVHHGPDPQRAAPIASKRHDARMPERIALAGDARRSTSPPRFP